MIDHEHSAVADVRALALAALIGSAMFISVCVGIGVVGVLAVASPPPSSSSKPVDPRRGQGVRHVVEETDAPRSK